MPSDNKTKTTDRSVDAFLDGVDAVKRDDSYRLIDIMQRITGLEPILWGTSIIGFGSQHYKYESGREGDMPLLAFSPRKANLTVYFNEGFHDYYGTELSELGSHTTSVSCLYIKRLEDIDLAVLGKMLKRSFTESTKESKKPDSVESYIAAIPQAVRPQFDELRSLLLSQLPNANEVYSYGIIGYKLDDKRAHIFISGYKDHVAIYPVPKEASLRTELEPYIRGKGTLWFSLGDPLPTALISRIISSLTS